MKRELKIRLAQKIHYPQVVYRYYHAYMTIYYSLLRGFPPPGQEDALRIGTQEFDRPAIRELLIHADSQGLLSDVLKADYNRVIDNALYSLFIGEMSSIVESNPNKKPVGQNIDTLLSKLNENVDMLSAECNDPQGIIDNLSRMHRKHAGIIKKFRDGRHATHHAYADLSIALSKVSSQGNTSVEVPQHIYNMLNRIGKEIFKERDLPDPFECFSGLFLGSSTDGLIWCEHGDYMSESEVEAIKQYLRTS